jgi:hypothetical protein
MTDQPNPPSRRWKLPDGWRWCVSIWLTVRLLLSIIGIWLWAQNLLPTQTPFGDLYADVQPIREGWSGALLGVWQRWDAVHWTRAVDHGYTDNSVAAFFPLYPLLSAAVKPLAQNSLLALLIVSNGALLIAMILLYETVQEQFSITQARTAVLFLAVYPTSFFLFAPYAGSLVLMFVLLAYRAARRWHWWQAFIYGCAAGLTHPTGVSVVALVGWEVWKHYRTGALRLSASAILAPLGAIVGAGAFLGWRALAGYASYIGSHSEAWQVQLPWNTILAIPQLVQTEAIWVVEWAPVLSFGLTVGTVLWGWKHLPREMWIYECALILLLLSTRHSAIPLGSFGRHCLAGFPLFIALSAWCNTSLKRGAVFGLFLAGQFYLASQFMLWRAVG